MIMKRNLKGIIFEFIIITIIGVISTAVFAIYLGQDMGPDMVNYHFYSGYLALHKSRLLTDIIPTNIQTYFTPYIYVPYYLLYKFVSPIWVGAIIGGIHGINFVCVYLIARFCLAHWPLQKARLASLLIAVFGLINPFFLSMLGASWSDNLTPILILPALAILLILKFPGDSDAEIIEFAIARNKYIRFSFAGFLIGLAVGFKLPNIVFAVGLFPAFLIGLGFRNRSRVGKFIKDFFFTFTGILAGFLLVNGSWMWSLWSNFQNPFFPLHNEIFKSTKVSQIYLQSPPLAAAHSYLDYFIYPFNWAKGIPNGDEWSFQDIRFAIIYILSFLLLILFLYRIFQKYFRNASVVSPVVSSIVKPPLYIINRWKFVLIWACFSYLFWISQFGGVRYLMPVTLLAGLIIFILLNFFTQSKNIIFICFLFIGIVTSATIKMPYFGRLMWENNSGIQPVRHENFYSWYPIKLPETLFKHPGTIYFINGLSIVIPFFPEESRFFGYNYLVPQDEFTELIIKEISHSSVPLRTLTSYRWTPMDDTKLAMFSLRRKPFDCLQFDAAWIQYETCGIEKLYPGIDPILLPDKLQIDFGKVHLSGVSNIEGFYGPEITGTWSISPVAKIMLVGELPSRFDLDITAFTFAKNSETGIDVIIGNQRRRIIFGNEMTTKQLIYEFDTGTDAGSIIQFEIPYPTSPSEIYDSSGDIRKLGIFIQSLMIRVHQP